jgi:cytosine permease
MGTDNTHPAARAEVLEAEYEHEPVPRSARKGLASVSLVWLGFPMVLTMALIGSIVVEGLGVQRGVAALLLGNVVLFGYVGALSVLAERLGPQLRAARLDHPGPEEVSVRVGAAVDGRPGLVHRPDRGVR